MRVIRTIYVIIAMLNAVASASNRAPGDLIVSETQNASFQGRILDIDPTTGQQQVIASGSNVIQPVGLCLDAGGNIVFSDFGTVSTNGAMRRINSTTLAQSVVTSGGNLSFPTSVSLDSNGQLLVSEQGLNGAVLRVDPTTGAQTVLASNLGVIEDVVVSKDLFIFADSFYGPGAVYQIDPTLGTATIISSGGLFNLGPHGICVNKSKPNSLLVTEGDGNTPANSCLIDVNTITGAQTRVAFGGNFIQPTDVTQDDFGTTYVTDIGPSKNRRGLVFRVDLQSGTQTVISSGGNLLTPLGIMVLPEPGLGIRAAGTIIIACRRGRKRQTCLNIKGAGNH